MGDTVYKKLINVQSELNAPKTKYNKFGQFYYRSCEDILDAVKPIAKKYGGVVIVSDEIVPINDRFYVKATAHFIDTETGEFASTSAYARESLEKKGMDMSQITGTASSYARKYALNGLFCIDDSKDADTNEVKNLEMAASEKKQNTKQAPQQTAQHAPQQAEEEPPVDPKYQQPGATPEQLRKIDGLVSEYSKVCGHKNNEIYDVLKKTVKFEKIGDITKEQGEKTIRILTSWIEKTKEAKAKAS